MKAVKISKKELLEALRKNRKAHRDIFLEAQDGYRFEAIKLLDKALKMPEKDEILRCGFS